MQQTPLLSVRLMVYQHEAYLKQAIDSILCQEVDFLVEIVIGDDFSQDESLAIAKRYKNQENFIFNVLERPLGGNYYKNRQGKKQTFNFADILTNCKGKYIALLDGDDYWTDCKKLALQVSYLEAHPAISISCHGTSVTHEGINPPGDGRETFYKIPKTGDFEFSFIDEFNSHFFHTGSIVFRKPNDFHRLTHFIQKQYVGDIPLILFLLTKGNGFYFKREMCMKRRNAGGITANPVHLKNKTKGMLSVWQSVLKISPPIHTKKILHRIAGYERSLSKKYYLNKSYLRGTLLFLSALMKNPYWLIQRIIKVNDN